MKLINKVFILLMVVCMLMVNDTIVYAYDADEFISNAEEIDLIVQNSIIDYESGVKENWDLLWENEHKKKESLFCNDGHEIVETCVLKEQEIFVKDYAEKLSAKTVLYSVAPTGSKQETDYDSVYTIKGHVTIYYMTVNVGETTCRRLTKVSGGYTWLDGSGSQITSQSVYYGMCGVGTSAYVNETDNKFPTGNSFAYNTGFTGAVNTDGIYSLGAVYTINLKRTASGSTWNLKINCSY